jgi:hypothetical protein
MKSPSLRSTAFLRLCAPFLISFGLISIASSQAVIHLKGRVSDPSGVGISAVVIIVTDEQTGQAIKRISANDGTYSIDIPPGIYSFTFSADGHTGATFHGVTLPHPDGASDLDAVLPRLVARRGDHTSGESAAPSANIDGSRFPPSDISRYTTGRSFLVGKEEEESGFGLYSYLLFSSRPVNDTEKQRNLAVIRAFITGMNDVADLESSGAAKGDLNVTYLLLTEHPEESVPSAEWVLSHYNFARAQVLLRPLAQSGRDVLKGPYVVSVSKPLSHLTETPEHYLWQDMSSVTPAVAASWEKEFMRCASRKEFWGADTRNQAVLNLRTFIASIADATTVANAGMAEFKKMLVGWVSWDEGH